MGNIRRIGMLVLVALATFASVAPARGALTILKSDGTETDATEATMVFNPKTGGWTIRLFGLYAPGDFTVYNVHGDEGEVIDDLDIAVPGAPGSPVVVHVISDTALGISTIHNIRKTGTADTTVSSVNVRVDIGSVVVDDIGILTAGRDVLGPIQATVAAELRGINTVEAQRDILGDVTADNGRIILVLSYGRIGTAAAPVTIRAKHNIIQIGSYGGMHGDVNSRFNGGAGRMFAFGATTFDGSLETEGLFSNPYNGWPGRIVALEHFDASITIGQSLDDPQQWIELPPTGFSGQITVNADNHPSGAWTSPVYLGSPENPEVELLGPHYVETASSLGGGSIGLASFALHESSCVPSHGGVLAAGPGAVVALRHYGPVETTGATPVTVERRVVGSNDAFTTLPASSFDYSVNAADANTLEVTGEFESGFEYRISTTDDLVSAVPAQPPVAWNRSYRVTVEGDPCPFDVDGDGLIGFDDLLDILSAWGPCKGCREDLDGDGLAGFSDVLLVLRDWGPCP